MQVSAENLDDVLYWNSVCNNIPLDRVLGKLFISSRSVLNNYSRYSIDHLITLFDFENPIAGIQHDIYDINDTQHPDDVEKLERHLEMISSSIHKSLMEGKNVCVHCKAGISRSATVVADYLLEYHNTGETTIRIIQKYRPIVNPNPAFVELLNSRHNIKLDW